MSSSEKEYKIMLENGGSLTLSRSRAPKTVSGEHFDLTVQTPRGGMAIVQVTVSGMADGTAWVDLSARHGERMRDGDSVFSVTPSFQPKNLYSSTKIIGGGFQFVSHGPFTEVRLGLLQKENF